MNMDLAYIGTVAGVVVSVLAPSIYWVKRTDKRLENLEKESVVLSRQYTRVEAKLDALDEKLDFLVQLHTSSQE